MGAQFGGSSRIPSSKRSDFPVVYGETIINAEDQHRSWFCGCFSGPCCHGQTSLFVIIVLKQLVSAPEAFMMTKGGSNQGALFLPPTTSPHHPPLPSNSSLLNSWGPRLPFPPPPAAAEFGGEKAGADGGAGGGTGRGLRGGGPGNTKGSDLLLLGGGEHQGRGQAGSGWEAAKELKQRRARLERGREVGRPEGPAKQCSPGKACRLRGTVNCAGQRFSTLFISWHTN